MAIFDCFIFTGFRYRFRNFSPRMVRSDNQNRTFWANDRSNFPFRFSCKFSTSSLYNGAALRCCVVYIGHSESPLRTYGLQLPNFVISISISTDLQRNKLCNMLQSQQNNHLSYPCNYTAAVFLNRSVKIALTFPPHSLNFFFFASRFFSLLASLSPKLQFVLNRIAAAKTMEPSSIKR